MYISINISIFKTENKFALTFSSNFRDNFA